MTSDRLPRRPRRFRLRTRRLGRLAPHLVVAVLSLAAAAPAALAEAIVPMPGGRHAVVLGVAGEPDRCVALADGGVACDGRAGHARAGHALETAVECLETYGRGYCAVVPAERPSPIAPATSTALTCQHSWGVAVYKVEDGSSDGTCTQSGAGRGKEMNCSGSDGAAGASCGEGCGGGIAEKGGGSCDVEVIKGVRVRDKDEL